MQFVHPKMLWLIPAAAVILYILITRDFVKLPLDPKEERRQRRARIWIYVSRLLLVSLLILALAGPVREHVTETKGNPRVTLLVDQSASTALYDTSFVDSLAEQLRKRIPTTVRKFGANLTSDVGSAVLRNLDEGGTILLVSDGNVNQGPLLKDVAFYAATVNATLSALNLTPAREDAAVIITGPGKVVEESDTTYSIRVTTTSGQRVHLRLLLDGATVLDQEVSAGTLSFTHQFTKGTHRLEAHLDTPDALSENNVFYKSVRVLEKPKILYLTLKNSPLELLLRQLYSVEKRATLPNDLSPYYAIVTNDLPVERLLSIQQLHNYLIDEPSYYGGGLVLFGGMNSFDRGGYSGSPLEELLPVKVGKGERKKGGANLVFLIDVSGSASRIKYRVEDGKVTKYEEQVSTLDVIKAQVVNAIEQLKLDNKLGVIVFGVPANTAASSAEERLAQTVRKVANLDYLYNNRKEVLEKIPRIQGGGPTVADVAFRGAVEMLKNVQGDKNIILLTDGRYSAGLGADSPMKRELLTMAANAHKLYGINFMTIGVGTTDQQLFTKKVDESFLKELAAAGDGTYDRATKLNTLLIKWGDPKAKEFGQQFSLVPLSLTHFITRGVEPTAVLNGYNEVVPKDTAQLLIAADSGQPALTVWRYGNGRVATWTVFAGNNLGQLLNSENSILLSRTINWAIGDPERKAKYFVDISDARVGAEGKVTVRSDKPVQAEGLTFTKEGDRYTAHFTPEAVGFATLLNQPYAVNRPSELDLVGLDPELPGIVESTGGKVFKPSDVEGIVELVKERSRQLRTVQEPATLPFLVAAMLLFLLEILLRRVTQRRR